MPVIPQFSLETEDIIVNRMLASMADDLDKRQGSVAYDLTMPTAVELSQAYFELDTALSLAFINEDMPSDVLTVAAAEFGVDRRESVRAVGTVTFTGTLNTVIPVGTKVRTNDGVYFSTTEVATLNTASVNVPVTADVGGANGNASIGDIDTVVGDLVGIIFVTNATAFTSGVDEESDELLIQRVYDRLRRPTTSGNIYHYDEWSREVPGVTATRVNPTAFGPGTVQVIVLGAEGRAPSTEVVTAVINNIEINKPIGSTVTVQAATEVPINVSVSVQLANNADIATVTSSIRTGVTEYLRSIAFVDSSVRYNRIASIILDVENVTDYSNLAVNGGTANVEVTSAQVGVLGTVTASAV